jgi:SAM-dependent methyltransferase
VTDTVSLRSVPDHEYGVAFRARYAACAACRSEYQTPMPGAAELAAFYPQGYHSFAAGGLLLRLRHDVRLRRLRALAPREGAILDYGCGDGAFLARAAERLPERQLFGFEIGERREITTRVAGRVTIVRGQLTDLLDVVPPCALVTMNHVIEHLPDPAAVVAALRARLVPGGILEGQTPAAGSLEHRLFGSRWSGYHAPRHTVVLSPSGLRRLLERTGLTQVAISGAFNPAGLALSLAALSHADAPGRLSRRGPRWLLCLGTAAMLAPVDLLSRAPAVIDFHGRAAG